MGAFVAMLNNSRIWNTLNVTHFTVPSFIVTKLLRVKGTQWKYVSICLLKRFETTVPQVAA